MPEGSTGQLVVTVTTIIIIITTALGGGEPLSGNSMGGNSSLYLEQVNEAYQSKVCWPLLMVTFPIIYLIYINLHHKIMGRKSPDIPITFPL